MKTWKHGIFGILAIIALALAFTACDDGNGKDDPEQPKYREKEITLNLISTNGVSSNDYNIKVSGTLLASEWNGVPEKVKSLLETAFPANVTSMVEYEAQRSMQGVLERTGTNVVVENTTAYPNYKIIGDGITLYLRFSVLNSISSEIILDAFNRINVNGTHSN